MISESAKEEIVQSFAIAATRFAVSIGKGDIENALVELGYFYFKMCNKYRGQ